MKAKRLSHQDLLNLNFKQDEKGNYLKKAAKSHFKQGIYKIPKKNKKTNKSGITEVTRKYRNEPVVDAEGNKVADSKLEYFMKSRLELFKIPFEFQKKFILQPPFIYKDKLIREIHMRFDFAITNATGNLIIALVDTKGMPPTSDWKNKLKMLQYVLSKRGEYPEIFIPSNKKECEALIVILKRLSGQW